MSSDKSKEKIVFSGNDIHYPGQTNHDACFIPVSVRQYAGEPPVYYRGTLVPVAAETGFSVTR
ncbi:Positive regulator GrlA [Salmonella enterica subsp. enterica]|uniref:Positive regulator GrlA n=1 Tax=Salmonella enterica I TaxID=59201 RepID=A0A3S4J3K5_SALET|nr:Positive regulator GrlA [Salmonella enterica subsp. enterica]